MEVIINGIKYVPATEAVANTDAIIRGLMLSFYGELGETYEDKLDGVYVVVTDDNRFAHERTMHDVITDISKYIK